MNSKPIGVFDSGLGGLTAFSELAKILPNEDLIYFGDTGRVPYGSRSPQTIKKYARDAVNFLMSKDVKMIISACGTVSSICGNELENELEIPFVGVVSHGAYAALNATKNGKIGVIGTKATIGSGAYDKAIKHIRADAIITAVACPLFVPLVENGYACFNNKIAHLVAQEYLYIMQKNGIDTLILGCTHYGLLSPIITDILSDAVTLIDVGKETARFASSLLRAKDMLTATDQVGNTSFFVSDDVESFAANASVFLKHPVTSKAKLVDIETITAI